MTVMAPQKIDGLSNPLFTFELSTQNSNPQFLLSDNRQFTAVDNWVAVSNTSKIFSDDPRNVWCPPESFVDACAARVSQMDDEATSDLHTLLNYLKDEDPCLRWLAAGEMGAVGQDPKDAQEPLIETARDETELLFVRLAAIESLGTLRSARAVPVLMGLMMNESENSHIISAALDALGEIGDAAEEAVPTIIRIKEELDSKDVTLNVIGTLTDIRTEKAISELIKISEDSSEDDFVREVAREALE